VSRPPRTHDLHLAQELKSSTCLIRMSMKKVDMSRLCSCRFTSSLPYHNQPQNDWKTGETRGLKSIIHRPANHSPKQVPLSSCHGSRAEYCIRRPGRLTLDSLLLEARRSMPEPQYLNEPIGKINHSYYRWVTTAYTGLT
jgi:hypothetical protein